MAVVLEKAEYAPLRYSNMQVKKYDVWMAEMREGIGVEQKGTRPVVIIQNDTGNAYSPSVIVAPLTSKPKKRIPTHVYVDSYKNGLPRDSIILTEQITTLDKTRLKHKITTLDLNTRKMLDSAILTSLGICV